MNYLTVNEMRVKKGLDEIPDGDVVLGLVKKQGFQSLQETRQEPTSRRPTEQPNEETQEE